LYGGAPKSFQAFPVDGKKAVWRVFLEAPLNRDGGRDVCWDLAVSFPRDYPYDCPVFRFVAIPDIPNVSETGRVDCRALRSYHPRMRVAALLVAVRELFDTDDDCGRVNRETLRWPSEKEWHSKMADRREACPWDSVAVVLEHVEVAPVERGCAKHVDEWDVQYSQGSWREVEPGQKSASSPMLVRRDAS
jgi:ubiquitin-protein ligase